MLKAGAFAQQIAGYAANLPTVVLSVGHAKVHFYGAACIFRIVISVGGDASARGSVEDFKITPVFEFFPLHPLHLVSPVHAPPYRYPQAGQSRSLPEDEPLLAAASEVTLRNPERKSLQPQPPTAIQRRFDWVFRRHLASIQVLCPAATSKPALALNDKATDGLALSSVAGRYIMRPVCPCGRLAVCTSPKWSMRTWRRFRRWSSGRWSLRWNGRWGLC